MAEPAILISGGAGYIGSQTLRHLASQGRKLVVLDNFVHGHHEAIVDEGIAVVDDPEGEDYPMPSEAAGSDAVWVGRIRDDNSCPNTLNLWIVADNLRKGAALNAVQIAENLISA